VAKLEGEICNELDAKKKKYESLMAISGNWNADISL